ncbi:MAG: cytochrome-c oxidase [Hydrocarboniphaga sp.]|uniref:cupredoxin domain-containing protein n=1 Tax=Hydrocarboniphaga sp. TaxID=2033016 RepID=UPI002601BCC9|nr:cupredoxin domain-containing protein [Hydrocarboniphaga sp.]MDB5970796.1 cytochrome-c oxidase [Hydrocarboniphaga sp.]
MRKTRRLHVAMALFTSTLLGFAAAAWTAVPVVRVVKVSAKRYEFRPASITISRGESLDLELVTDDVLMGFNAPDLGVRSNIVPGQVSCLRITPQKTGTFPFLCDVFCGSGHEDMNGSITVVD